MPDPLVVTQANAFRAALLRREATQLRTMTRAWLTVERALEQGITYMLAEIDVLRAGGRVFGRNPDPYLQLERYRALLRQTQRELDRWGAATTGQLEQGVFAFAQAGARDAAAAILAATDADAALLASFNRLNVAAVENIAGVLQANAPVGELLRQAFPEALVRMTDALVNGTALGWNPRKTAAAMAQGLQSAALQRAMVIARTEQLRAYRTATLESYRASGIVTGYKRLAAKSARTCLPCLLADGTVYELQEEFAEHPSGRCVCIPILRGRPDPTWATGREWFERQPAARQRDIMGVGAWRAWKDGAVALDDLVVRREHPTWGASLGVRPLRDAVGVEAAKAYSASAATAKADEYATKLAAAKLAVESMFYSQFDKPVP